jgi:Na+-driven multidrug efflux pump
VGLNIFCIYILVDLIRFSNMTLILSAAGKTRTIMRLGMASIGMNAVLNVLFYHQIGMSGPALATFLSVLITGVLMLYFGSRELGTRLWKLFDGKYLAVFTLENLAAVTVFSALRNHLASVGMHYFPVLVIVGGGYGLLMLLLHGKRLLRSLKNVNKVTGSN